MEEAEEGVQHDAAEVRLSLLGALEDEAAGEGAVARCLDALFKGSKEIVLRSSGKDVVLPEQFLDLRCSVVDPMGRPHGTLEAALRSLRQTVEVKSLSGAPTGSSMASSFPKLPPVLAVHIERSDHDAGGEKSSSRLDFPERLDTGALAPGGGEYVLHSVVSHSGTAASGHYVVFARPSLRRWYIFEDESVGECTADEAVREQSGQDAHARDSFATGRSPFLAFMLTYLREDMVADILGPGVGPPT
mmetsp:Transcript_91755/g.255501  ORF Transcript_91755/g.255501 Transcript_91755/m.255501 type:complete len:246 (-) Transcript_91755:33-770(-)